MKKAAYLLASLLSAMVILAGCGTPGQNAGENGSGEISLVGSTSVQPLAEMLAEAYMAKNEGIMVTVQGGGSSVGVKTVSEGGCDIGMTSRALKDEEKSRGIVEATICYDGIAVVLHPSNSITDLSIEQIYSILTGAVVNWSQVGGPDRDITVYTREASSGTREALVSLLHLEDENKNVLITENAIECNGNGVMKTNVAGNEGAIGYVSLGSLDETLKAVTVGGVQASVGNVHNQTYPLYRPFNLATLGEPEGLARDFIDFALGEEGQAIAAEKWIPLG